MNYQDSLYLAGLLHDVGKIGIKVRRLEDGCRQAGQGRAFPFDQGYMAGQGLAFKFFYGIGEAIAGSIQVGVVDLLRVAQEDNY
ncbi:MAG: hypothetical protein PWP70_1112 [Moorella sp. (in: firmicutes)]|nr:hypothetical protein [Moorella sp. (in: firmicutes)]